MYSTLLVLDRPRHLRFTFNEMSEWEQAIPGGFMSLFRFPTKGDVGFTVLRDILYAGLRWEDPTLTQSKLSMMLLYDGYDQMYIWKRIYDALIYDEWIQTPENKEESGQSGQKQDKQEESMSIMEMLDNVEELAYGTVGLTPAELYSLTPREFNIMLENFGEIENQRVGLICATILNSQGGKKGGEAFTPEDFYTSRKQRKPKIMSDEEIRTVLKNAFGFGG